MPIFDDNGNPMGGGNGRAPESPDVSPALPPIRTFEVTVLSGKKEMVLAHASDLHRSGALLFTQYHIEGDHGVITFPKVYAHGEWKHYREIYDVSTVTH